MVKIDDHEWNDSSRMARALEVIAMLLLADHIDAPMAEQAIVEAARRHVSYGNRPSTWPVWLPTIIMVMHERLSPKAADVILNDDDR